MQENELKPAEDLGTSMKLGMRRWASGVSVLSTRDESGERHAMTVSSMTSVSDNPASLLVCVNTQVALEGHLSTPGTLFAVNVLSTEHKAISNRCAGFEGEKPRFDIGQWRDGPREVPYLEDAQATFFCQCDQVMTYGTHHIVVARIVDVKLGPLSIDPLLYIDGGYASLGKD
ncbi:flavin reductase family protein [Marinimicrobium sp. C2-29]|uniref:flavin reductase family protein n=1 Tax=Marinimicrobium sp. C2-29 TaxID=3139825 RepID=UPI003138E96B